MNNACKDVMFHEWFKYFCEAYLIFKVEEL
jgi:hypothetical protein